MPPQDIETIKRSNRNIESLSLLHKLQKKFKSPAIKKLSSYLYSEVNIFAHGNLMRCVKPWNKSFCSF